MKSTTLAIVVATALLASSAQGATLFPLQQVRLLPGPFLDAQQTNQRYLLDLDPDKLLAPYLREAGITPAKDSYGNWESSGLDGHLGGHYLSALALMAASTGDPEVLRRLNDFVAQLKRAQDQQGDGYLGGIPGGKAALEQIAQGKLQADNFSVNGKWVPWYNLHKIYAGLYDAWRLTGNADARAMLVRLADWALALSRHLSPQQMDAMLRSEHGGMNEVLAQVSQMTGEPQYLELAKRFSHQALLQPLEQRRDALSGLHANTQIPKVIGFHRIGTMAADPQWKSAAQFFWQTVVDHRTVAIGGNSVKEHFHDNQDFKPMVQEVEGPETCNTYNMLKLTQLLYEDDPQGKYTDYYERALYNHILSSQHPGSGGFVYFTPMRPNHYRVYSQVDQGMWCCVGSGIESQAKYGEFIYAHDGDDGNPALLVNLYIPSTLDWKEQGVRVRQDTRFPDQDRATVTVERGGAFTLKLRYPGWVAPGALRVRVNGKRVNITAQPGGYVALKRDWRAGDRVQVHLPMTTRLEQMPDRSNYYAVLHGPIVLAAKTRPFANEKLNFLADDSRMGHIAQGQVCPLEAAPLLVSDSKAFMHRFKPVKGEPLTFTAPGLVQGKDAASTRFIPFFRLHDARYMLYWQHTTPANLAVMRVATAKSEAERLALDARTIDQVAPGEQQPESDHFFQGEGADAGVNNGRHWRHASGWFSYELNDREQQASVLRLAFSAADAGRKFDIVVNDRLLQTVELARMPAGGDAIYSRDFPLPAGLGSKISVKFVAQPGSVAGGLYGLRLLKH
ncbi:MAG: glycoside hydrolase family 127 protein [Burkholderiaceae bacterium]|nr:glycoside hydrolase family 127 protein [Burkholderiaceae bacterium]